MDGVERNEDRLLCTNHDVTPSNHRTKNLEEQVKIIKDDLREIRLQDQTILRTLLENYQKFLSKFEERRSNSLMRQTSVPMAGTNQRLDTVRSMLGQQGTLDIRQVSNRLFPPGRRRLESEPTYYVPRLSSSVSFEETFEGIFSDEEEMIVDRLSTSSFT